LKKAARKKIPLGLAQVRKEIPPPGKIFRSKKNERRQLRKVELRRSLKETPPGQSS
jgi:hypothetical protein